MQPSRVVTLVGGGAFLVAWIAAAAVDRVPSADAQAVGTTRAAIEAPPDPQVADVLRQASRLRERLNRPARAVAIVRDPFRFGDRRPIRPQAVRGPSPIPQPTSEPREPVLRLIGIAQSLTAGVVVRTAILSGDGETFLVSTGDDLTTAYRVGLVGAEAVELIRKDGTSLTLAFE